jgi:hypothetical protein
MAHLAEFPLEGGGTVTVEVADAPAPSVTRRGLSRAELEETAACTFESAIQKIKPAAAAILGQLSAFGAEEIKLEFGLKLNTEVGAFIASAAAESNFRVSLLWKRKDVADRRG